MLVNGKNYIFSLLSILFIIQKIFVETRKSIKVNITFSLETNIKAVFHTRDRGFVKENILSSYSFEGKKTGKYIFTSLSYKNLIQFINRLLENFVDENNNSSIPYLSLNEENFEKYCSEINSGNYYFEA